VLVEAIGAASQSDRELVAVAPPTLDLETMPESVRAFFDRPVVAMHVGAGNLTKQWPIAHFSAVIDLLAEDDGVNVLLVGGPDERDMVEPLMSTVQRRERVTSLVGQTSLTELPRILSACVLYIGNDSGPKHIAAALGVPTLGIHSGVVDAMEWGPLGRRAVAMRRNMSCSPCYLAKAADCPRELACLNRLEPALVHQTAQLLLGRVVAGVVAPVAEREGEPVASVALAPHAKRLALTAGSLDLVTEAAQPERSGQAKSAKPARKHLVRAKGGRRSQGPNRLG
jgi:hypothetical protein